MGLNKSTSAIQLGNITGPTGPAKKKKTLGEKLSGIAKSAHKMGHTLGDPVRGVAQIGKSFVGGITGAKHGEKTAGKAKGDLAAKAISNAKDKKKKKSSAERNADAYKSIPKGY
jgi:hypothetical protein